MVGTLSTLFPSIFILESPVRACAFLYFESNKEVDVNIERLQSIAGILEVRAEDLIQNSVVFNNIGNNYNIYSTIYQQQSTKIEKLYEEQISLLKGKIQDLENWL